MILAKKLARNCKKPENIVGDPEKAVGSPLSSQASRNQADYAKVSYCGVIIMNNAPTFDEIRSLFRETGLQLQELTRKFAETDRKFMETDRKFAETDRKFMETDRKFEEVAFRFKETDRKFADTDRKFEEVARNFAETDRKFAETDRKFIETDRRFRATERAIKELGQQIGGLGNKFGSFTEGLALPSMQKILRQRFNVDTVSPSVRTTRNGKHLELDVLAYANGEVNAAYIVEVKSHVRRTDIEQLLRILREFPNWFPEHANKGLYGILAGVDIHESLIPEILGQGLYLAYIHNDLFDLQIPDDFQPRRFDRYALANAE